MVKVHYGTLCYKTKEDRLEDLEKGQGSAHGPRRAGKMFLFSVKFLAQRSPNLFFF